MHRTLLIGATGFAGVALVRRLREAGGYEITGLARNEAAEKKLAEAGVLSVRGDFAEPEKIVPLLPRFDSIVCMVRIDYQREFRGVQILLDALVGTGKRFIFTSGTSVCSHLTYGDWHDASYSDYDEIKCLDGSEPKRDAENITRAAHMRGIHGMVIRPPMIWGYGSQRGLRCLHESAHTGAVCYLGRGLNTLGSIHVDDLADIYLLALQKGVAGALYHTVSGENSWRAMAHEVARLRGLPARSIDFAEAEKLWGFHIAKYNFSLSNRTRCPRTITELGWTPNPDRLDVFGQLAHPNFMSLDKPSNFDELGRVVKG